MKHAPPAGVALPATPASGNGAGTVRLVLIWTMDFR